jgi:protein involved in polysaccharide export with SLBB domain
VQRHEVCAAPHTSSARDTDHLGGDFRIIMSITQRVVMPWLIATCLAASIMASGCSSQKALRSFEGSGQTADGINRRDVRSSNYVIQYGDQIQLTVFGYPEFNSTPVVKESGSITVPLVGEIRAVGLTRDQLTEQVITRLGEFVKSKVMPTITVTGAMSQRVVILGSVSNQGSYPLSASASPFQVLALAGGPTKEADLSHIRVMKNGDPANATDLDLSEYVDTGAARLPMSQADLPTLSPGDVVYVPKEENLVRSFADLLRDVVVLFGIFALAK